MLNIILMSLALSASPQDVQRDLVQMRMAQTQPQYAQRYTPLPPGCGPYWDAQRAYQSMPKPYENVYPYWYSQPYSYYPYYYRW